MKTTYNSAYVITNMPRHGDSILAIAYSPVIDPLQLGLLSRHIEALKNEDFDIANAAYQNILAGKINGLITDYAIADTTVAAIKELNLRLPKHSFLALGRQLWQSLSVHSVHLYDYFYTRHNKHQIFP